ncbi:glycerophosphodiester phosphodiesterase [Cohnella mopanensis]|uniref:glycerophosphodiester phosphodiesterase n=1 Tax=Cohnella mopanensis TaxID=2911966 RepID=UPI001EF7D547|nr:glycerophosphodiester phosphodiesterase family protein [Cohnella mopanensis]
MNGKSLANLHPCVAHRGFSGKAPENTMAAFHLAISQAHVGWIELDVHLSRDEVPVVIHDSTLKRTTNSEGRVIDHTAEELGKLDAGSWFHSSFSSEGVPTLDEVLNATTGKCLLNVELKGDDSDHDLLAKRAVEVIRSHRLEDKIIVTSFRTDILRAVRRYSPSLRLGLIIDERPEHLVQTLISLDATYLSIGFRHIDETLLEQTSEASIDVMAWTVNSIGDLRRLATRSEPFQLCTNYPDRWLSVMKEENPSHE